ncbi:MAG TPA: glycoside hydrolase family 3 N-terminal domain-containing protein [Gemmatimonadales bacterium]|nr:glycoside hydrolase family 3 N-terminal domain-containing protein [Gemmatimonadales bacterium]
MHGRLILPALRWRPDSGFDHEAHTIAAALDFGAGGFILFGGQPEAVRALTAEVHARAARPLLIAADLERGAGQQFPGLTEFPPPGALGFLNNPDFISAAAATTAREALALGINWVLAPDADLDLEPANPIVQTRSFGGDPAAVGAMAAAWVTACQAAGAIACVKHFPGHGRTTRDSHDEVPGVLADAATLRRTDLVPFEAGVRAGVASVMTGHLRVPALDPTGTPATFSAPILRYLREQLGFNGLIVTDALMMGAAVKDAAENPAVRALAAGCDLLCYPADPQAAYDAIGEALRTGTLAKRRVAEALARYEEALRRAGAPNPLSPSTGSPHPLSPSPGTGAGGRGAEFGSAPPPHMVGRGMGGGDLMGESGRGGQSAVIAGRLLAQGMIRGAAPRLRAPLDLVVVDDDQGGAWPASPNDYVEGALDSAGIPLGSGGSRVVLAFAEPRASKGRAGFGPASLEALRQHGGADLMILFGHPRLVQQLPGGAPVLLAWHRQRLMQDAAARWIGERLG